MLSLFISKKMTKKSYKEFANQVENNLNNFQNDPIKIKENIKFMYDFLKSDQNLPQGKGLPELIIKDFHAEEIWWQLDAEYKSLHFPLKTDVLKLISEKDQLYENTQNSEPSSEEDESESELKIDTNESDEEVDGDVGSEDKDESDENEEEEDVDQGMEVKDKFFDLKAMQKFLDDEDKKAMQDNDNASDDDDNESEIDLFEASDEDDNDAANIKYKNFFDPPENDKKESKTDSDDENGEEMSEQDSENENDKNEESQEEGVSTFELRQDRLKKKINHLEKAALEEKGWQLKGEITADTRPQNSLLEEDLDFDVTARPQLKITAETNLRLEDIILQRIKDKAWDSVKRKVKPVDDPLEFKKKLALESEKSKESLAQIYEKEYLKQKEAIEGDQIDNEEPPEKTKTTAMINNLFSKLDALSHFYFTPRLVKPEAKIISNLPAIQMEEVAPVGVSDAHLLAPEEVRAKDKAAPTSKDERSKTDKKRERKSKKVKQRKRRLDAEARSKEFGEPKTKKQALEQNEKLLKMVTRDRNVQVMDISSTKVGKSSDKFFNNLQEQIASKGGFKKKHKNDKFINSKKFKL